MPDDKFEDAHAAIIAAGKKLPDLEPLEDWADIADAFAADPTLDNFQQLKEASRNLSSNLRGVGVDITPDRLARAADHEVSPDRHTGSPEDEQVNDYSANRYPGRQ
jgi:hypothetical protein